MKKYLVLSFCIHALLFISFFHYQRAGKENIKLNQVISVSFVVENVKPSENPGTPNLAEKKIEKKENAVNEKQKEQPKKEKPKKEVKEKEKSFDSKMATKDAKVVEKEEANPKQAREEGTAEESKEEASGNSNPFYGSNFQANGDGSYTALSSEGISYEIIHEVSPEYPSQAESISYEKKAVVKVKFLVDLKGNVEDIQIVQSHKKLGFDDEVRKAIKKWKFKPIYYSGKNIKVYFVKEFIFNPR